jgi:sugar porter (SP) family MFS transporter
MKINLRYVIGISLISALAGFLFGYDWVVIGGAKPFYERFFEISGMPGLQGLAMSSALIGCVGGAAVSGWIGIRLGRRGNLVLAALFFIFSAVGTGATSSFFYFMAFRVLGGIGIGIASATAPVYIAEVSPPAYRGRMVSLNQLNIVIGILAAQIINYLIARPVPDGATDLSIQSSWNGQMGWRWMFWAEAAPSSIFLALLYFIPESPRWLASVARREKSVWILEMIGGEEYARSAWKEIEKSLSNHQKAGVRSLFRKKYRPVLMLGILLAMFQQWCGINVVFNYAEEVFTSAGYQITDILFNIVITGVVNLIFTYLAIRTVDRWGRRRLMLIGSAGLAILYTILGFSYLAGAQGLSILIIVVVSIALYAMTLAPVTWVVLSEIFPNKIRGMAMAAATTMLWVASAILVVSFPYLNAGLNAYGTFWVYAGICLAGFLYIYSKLPETKGKSLEEIEMMDGPDR